MFFIKLEMENGNFPSSEKKGKYDVRIKAIKFDSGMDRVKDLELFFKTLRTVYKVIDIQSHFLS